MEIPGQGLFFRFNDYHHDLAVFQARDGAEPASKNHAGVAHIAMVADDFATVLRMYRRLREHGVPVSRTIDRLKLTFRGPGLHLSAISTHVGAWSLALSQPRTSRSTPALISRAAIEGLRSR